MNYEEAAQLLTEPFKDNVCCVCGTKAKDYDGGLGYEAVYCPKCGIYSDHQCVSISKEFKEVE